MNPESLAPPPRPGPRGRVRMPRPVFERWRTHALADPSREQFAFALARLLPTPDGPVLLIDRLCLPGSRDLASQTATRVAPTPDFQATLYAAAEADGSSIVDLHTHTTGGDVAFSAVDDDMAERNRAYIGRRFAPPTTLGLLVFNRDLTCVAGRYFSRTAGAFALIDGLELVGRPCGILRLCAGGPTPADGDAAHVRQALVPGWNQDVLAAQRVVIIGAGGNGAHLVQALAGMGVGTRGWLMVVDPDRVEASNLPRIPYALPSDVGHPKVSVAADFVRRKDSRIPVYAFACPAADAAVEARVRAATIVFGAGDNDGVRKTCNAWCVRYGLPYIDLGCDIQIEGGVVQAGGQVRVVVPGQTACLVCAGGIDPAAAALDEVSDAVIEHRAAAGYVIGAAVPTTPSVASLNALTAHLAVTAFLALLRSGPFTAFDYAHIDFLTGRTLTARTQPRASCPFCGLRGVLHAGPVAPVVNSEPQWAAVAPYSVIAEVAS